MHIVWARPSIYYPICCKVEIKNDFFPITHQKESEMNIPLYEMCLLYESGTEQLYFLQSEQLDLVASRVVNIVSGRFVYRIKFSFIQIQSHSKWYYVSVFLSEKVCRKKSIWMTDLSGNKRRSCKLADAIKKAINCEIDYCSSRHISFFSFGRYHKNVVQCKLS